MGWTVLYIAFGVVALWLLGEVLLQYKARLRWRILAFCGFLGVVAGVLLPSVAVIVLGAVGFAVGQTFVTLSFRRGFSTGWALGGNPGASRRRKAGTAPQAGPTLEVTGLQYEDGAAPVHDGEQLHAHDEAEPAVYAPEPLPEDTGRYGVYDPAPAAAPYGGQPYPEHQPYADQPYTDPSYGAHGYDAQGHPAPDPAAAPGYDPYAPTGYEQQPAYDYGTGPRYAAYSDPYIGGAGTVPEPDAGLYGGGYPADPYAPSYTYDTPPGGVWVPQQRDTEQPPQPQAPGAHGYEQHPDDQSQYRY